MSRLRFEVGTSVMCNLGPDGWKLGRIIALDYREDHWPIGKDAPYEVLLNDNHTLIYVPEDNSRYCREATNEDLKIAHRMDALDVLPSEVNMIKSFNEESNNFDSSNKSSLVVNKVKQNMVVLVIEQEDAIAVIIFLKTGLMPNFTVNTTAALLVMGLELLDKQLTLVGFLSENRLNTNQDKTC